MKREEKTEITRQKILSAAINEFGTNGYAAGSVNKICKTGINKGLIYHNYRSKDELYLKCVEKSCEDLIQYVICHNAEIGFVEYMNARWNFFKEHVPEAHIFLEARTNPPLHLVDRIHTIFSTFNELNINIFEHELSKHTLRRGVLKEEAIAYFFEIQKIYNRKFANESNDGISLDRQLELHEMNIHKIFDLMLYGIAEGGNEL